MASYREAERSGRTMIEKPTHVEPSRPLADEKPSTNGSHHPILGELTRVGRPMRLAIVGAISIIALLAFIPSWIQKWLWMRQLGYAGVFWTLLSVRWELSLRGFRCYASVPLDQSSPCGEKRRHFPRGCFDQRVYSCREIRHPGLSHGFETGHGHGRCRRRPDLCGHLLCTMGYVSPLSLWRILWVVRSSLRGRCWVLSVPSPLL